MSDALQTTPADDGSSSMLATSTIDTNMNHQEGEYEENASFDDTIENLLAQIDSEVHTAETTVANEINATLLDEARHLRSQRANLASIIDRELKNLITRTHACRFKRTKYGRILSGMQMTGIVLAIALGAFVSVAGIVEQDLNETFTGAAAIAVDSTVPVVTACIALLGALVTHKKLMEKMEAISKAIEKSIYIQAQLPGLMDRVHGCKSLVDYEKLESEYQGEPSRLITSCKEQIGQALSLEDDVVHSEAIQFYQIRAQASEANYIVQSENIRVQKNQKLERLARVEQNIEVAGEETPVGTMDPIEVPVPTYWDTVGTHTHHRSSSAQETCWSKLCPCCATSKSSNNT